MKFQKKVLTFHMAKINSHLEHHFVGSLLDDGAPNSGLGIHQLKLLTMYLKNNWNGQLEALPSTIADHTRLQYGSGTHSSESRKMKNGMEVNIRHVVIEKSSQ